MKKIISLLLVVLMLSAPITVMADDDFEDIVATSVSSLTSTKNSIKVTWKKNSNVDGYQIQYSTNSNFKSAKKVTIDDSSKSSKKIEGLKSNKKYYVRVRAYVYEYDYEDDEVDKEYSLWSKSKTIKTKAVATTTKKVSSSNKSSSKGSTIYVTPTGKKYHKDPHCNGGTYIKSSLSDAKKRGLSPCKKCC